MGDVLLNCMLELQQIDLQSSEKEKERLAAELQKLRGLADSMDEVKQENRELCRRLSQQETVQNLPKDDLKVGMFGGGADVLPQIPV